MDRRVAGLLVVVAVVLAAVIAPNVAGHRVVGNPVAEVIAAPPVPGDCILTLTERPGSTPQGSAPGEAGWQPRYFGTGRAYPVVTTGPCTGPVIGEVVSAQGWSPTQSTLGEYQSGRQDCRFQVDTYLGVTPFVHGGTQWSTSILVNARRVGPSAHDRAAGATWSACVMTTFGQSYRATGSLSRAVSRLELPGAYGLCWSGVAVVGGTPTACTAPHRTQQLGYASVPESANRAALQSGCRALAATILDTPDPTRGGLLRVSVAGGGIGSPVIQCTVASTGSRLLTASLMGLRTHSVPLTG